GAGPPLTGEEGGAGAPQADRALGGDDPRQFVHTGVEVGARDDLGDQADVAALGGGDAGAGVVELERVLRRDVPVDDRHDHHGPEADVDLRSAELNVVGGDHEVARGGQPQTARDGVTGT